MYKASSSLNTDSYSTELSNSAYSLEYTDVKSPYNHVVSDITVTVSQSEGVCRDNIRSGKQRYCIDVRRVYQVSK